MKPAIGRPKRARSRFVRAMLAAPLVAFVVLGMALPLVVGRRDDRLAVESASVMAGPRDSFVISEAISVGGVGGLDITRGTLSLVNGAALSGIDADAHLKNGRAHLKLERGTIRLGQRSAKPAVAISAGIDPTVAPLVRAIMDFKLDALTVVDGTLHLNYGQGRSEIVNAVNVVLTRGRRGAIQAKGSVGIRGQVAHIDATLLPGTSTPVHGATPVKLKLQAPLLDVAFDGTAAIGAGMLLQGTADIATADARRLSRWLGFGWPDGPGLRNVKISGSVDWNGATIAVQRARLSLDGNEATGTVSLRTTTGRPVLNGTLALATLDITPYLKGWLTPTSTLDAALGTGSGPFALPLAEHVDADVRISADRVRAYALDLGRGAATLSVKDGRLQADVAELNVFNSRFSGLLSVSSAARQPRYSIKTKITGADLGALASALGRDSAIQGKGDIVADLEAAGEWATDIARSANGKVAIAMKEGGRIGFDFRSLSELARRTPIRGWSNATRSSIDIESLDARLVLTDGVVLAEGLSALTPEGLLSATGGGNLRTGVVDLRVSLGGRRAMRSEREALALDSTRDALQVRGSWAEPTFRFEAVHGRQIPSSDATGARQAASPDGAPRMNGTPGKN